MGASAQIAPMCKVCDNGALIRQKVYRMSGPAVVIGYIFLIPSILGIILSILALAAVVFAGHASANTADATGVAAAQTLVGGFTIVFGLASFVGGLLGWLLVMKKRVLRCNNCSSTINAS